MDGNALEHRLVHFRVSAFKETGLNILLYTCSLLSDYNIHVRSCIYIYHHRGPRPSDRRLSNRGLSPNSGKVTLLVITMSNIYLKSTPIRTQRATWDSHHLFPFCKFPATYGNNNLIIYTGGKWLFRETSGVFPFRPAKRRSEKREMFIANAVTPNPPECSIIGHIEY